MNGKLALAGALWLSGFVAGVVLVGRWRRMGGTEFEIPMPEPVSDEASTASSNVRRTAQRVARPILAGAKADVLTVRNASKKVSHRVTSRIGRSDTATVN
jgi:hypothetical protein